MSLREAAETVGSNLPGPKCGVHILRLGLEAEDRTLFDSWLPTGSGKTSTWIADVLKSDGHQISEFTVQRHRRQKCSCNVAR